MEQSYNKMVCLAISKKHHADIIVELEMAPVLGTVDHLDGDYAVLMVDTTPSSFGCQAGNSLQYMQTGLKSSSTPSRVAFQDMMELEYSDSTEPLAPYVQPFSQGTQQYVALLLDVTGCGMGLSALEVAADRRENFDVADVVRRSGAQVVAAAYFSSTVVQSSKVQQSRKKAQSPFQKRSPAITILNHETAASLTPTPVQGGQQPPNPPPITVTPGGQLPAQTFQPLQPLPGSPPSPPGGNSPAPLLPPSGGPPQPPQNAPLPPANPPLAGPPPGKAQPVQPQPIQPQPVQSESAQATPTQPQPLQSQPLPTQPVQSPPVLPQPIQQPGQAQASGSVPPILRAVPGATPVPVQNQNQLLPTSQLLQPIQSLLPGLQQPNQPIHQQPGQPIQQQPGGQPIQQQPGQQQPGQQQPGQQQPGQQIPGGQNGGTLPAIIATGVPQNGGQQGGGGQIRTAITTPFVPGQTGAVGGALPIQSASSVIPGAGGGALPPILRPVNGGGAQPSNGVVQPGNGVGNNNGQIGGIGNGATQTAPLPGQQTQPNGLPIVGNAGVRVRLGWGAVGGVVLAAALLM